jgi:hypothetical protein
MTAAEARVYAERQYVDIIEPASIMFDTGLFEAIRSGLNHECQFKVEVKDGNDGKTHINVKDVIYIGSQYYEFGKPAQV